MSISISAATQVLISIPCPETTKAQATLPRLEQTYKQDVQQGQTAAQLLPLARSISSTAKMAGESAQLPPPRPRPSGLDMTV